MSTLVSIIMPCYNSGSFIKESIESVIRQSYTDWELIIVDDGSTDNSVEIAKSFNLGNISIIEKENGGVSSARNVGIEAMKGDFFCFLDADDILPINSLRDRIHVFEKDDQIEFVDGDVLYFSKEPKDQYKRRIADYSGNPLEGLCKLNSKCFFGNTWMIKRIEGKTYHFKEGLSHGEDLLFYFSIAQGGKLSCSNTPVLYYRTGNISAMSNLIGLEKGYNTVYDNIEAFTHIPRVLAKAFRKKAKSIMFKCYLSQKQFSNAFKTLLT